MTNRIYTTQNDRNHVISAVNQLQMEGNRDVVIKQTTDTYVDVEYSSPLQLFQLGGAIQAHRNCNHK